MSDFALSKINLIGRCSLFSDGGLYDFGHNIWISHYDNSTSCPYRKKKENFVKSAIISSTANFFPWPPFYYLPRYSLLSQISYGQSKITSNPHFTLASPPGTSKSKHLKVVSIHSKWNCRFSNNRKLETCIKYTEQVQGNPWNY